MSSLRALADPLFVGAASMILFIFVIPFVSYFREVRRKKRQADAVVAKFESRLETYRSLIVFVLLFLCVSTSHAQVLSTLPDNGAAILQTPYSQQTSVLIAGHFTSPSQTVSDLAAFDASGNINCYSNQGNGIFRPVLTSTGIPAPLTAGSALNFSVNGNPQTDRFFTGDLNQLFEMTISNCAASATVPPIPYLNVLSIAKTASNTWTCVSETPSPSGCPGGLGTNIVTLPSNLLGPLFSELVFIQQPWAQTGGPGVGQAVTFLPQGGSGQGIALSGDIYLGTFFLNSEVVAISSTDNEIFIDQISYNQKLVSTPLQSFSVSDTHVVGAVIGNFLNGVYDLAVANGNEVDLFAYRNSSWAFDSATQVGPITAITHGNIVSASEDDVVVQVGSNAIVLGSNSVGEQAATPIISPASGTYASPQSVTISDSSNATIFYTTDGSAPSTSSAVYNGAINVATTETISAIAGGGSFLPSATASATYAINADMPPQPPDPPNPPLPSISVTPLSQTCAAGCTASYLVTASNFTGTAPSTIAEASIPKGSCSAAGHVVTCTTTASSTSAATFSYRGPLAIILAIFAWFALPRRRRLVWAFGVLALAGCGSGGTKSPLPTTIPGTPAGQYQIVITASNATQSAQTNAMLGIQ